MQEQQYYQEIEHLIKKHEVSKRVRRLEANSDLVTTYWNVGRLIVEAQGGNDHAKYGNELIRKWSNKFTKIYGKGYSETNLKTMRKFYVSFVNGPPLADVSWTVYRELLPIKDENKRNFYINLCIKNNLSKRELIQEIKSNSYERLLNKPEKIEIEMPKTYSITTDMKNPIIIPVASKVNNEHDLEINILADLDYFFKQLGNGFAYIAHQYKLVKDNHNYFIDILLFNYEFNVFVIIELKLRSLRKEDKAQMEFYMKLADEQLRKPFHNKTIGIIITKESNEFIVNFVRQENVIPLTYELEQLKEIVHE